MLSGSTLALLGIIWGAFLLPRALSDMRSSPVSTVTGFTDAMARLAVADQRLLVVPAGAGRTVVVHPRQVQESLVRRRRRIVLTRLLTAALGTTLVAAVAGGPVLWSLAGVTVVGLVAYCAALRSLVVRRDRAAKVVPLHPTQAPAAVAHVEPVVDDEVREAVLFAVGAPRRSDDRVLVAHGG